MTSINIKNLSKSYGTTQAVQKLSLEVKKGELFGSVSSDKPEYARAIIELAIAKATGNELPEDIKEKCPDGKYYKVSQYIVTTESLSKITH